jgi:hypothetical protein
MTRRKKSHRTVRGRVFDEEEVVRLLKAAVAQEGGQSAFARRHDLSRVALNQVLIGKRPVSGSLAKTIGLRKAFVAE